MRIGSREINEILCSCGGKPVEAQPTIEEEKEYGCGRSGCCVKVFCCPLCGTRWVFDLESPEVR